MVSYCGLDVVENQSGKTTGQTRISKKGNSRIRRGLFLPTLTTIKLKTDPFYSLYQRVVEKNPKIKMKGVVAVQKKLLITMYSIFKNETSFENNYYQKVEEIKSEEVETIKNPSIEVQSPISKPRVIAIVDQIQLETFNKKLARQNDRAKQDEHYNKNKVRGPLSI